jgi:WD40 repeat protein
VSDLIGEQWGNYRLVKFVSRNGLADLYMGNHVRLKTPATLEIFHAQLAKDGMPTFQCEAQKLIQLRHAHILRLLDFDVQEGRPFFVLDDAPNGSLHQRYPYGTRVPLEQVILYAQQVASALQYAHDRKLVHGEVRPEHMLLGTQDTVLLSSFGMSAVVPALASINAQAPLGALAYIAPEQIQGQPQPASDQYALAVTIYQWLCGVWPFQGQPTEIVVRHLSLQPPPLRQYSPELTSAVEQVVLRALEKEPTRRFASVQDFVQALHLASQGVASAQPASSPMQAQPVALAQATPSGPVGVPPVQAQPVVPGQPAQAQAGTGSQGESRRALLIVGAAVVVGLAVPIGLSVLTSIRQSTTSPAGALVYTYQGQRDERRAIFWSPDSKRVLSAAGKGGTLHLWDALNGEHLTTYKPLLELPYAYGLSQCISWAQADPLYLWLDSAIVHVSDVVTGQDLYTVDGADPGNSSNDSLGVCWSPDGSLFASIESNINVPSAVRVHKASDGSSVSSFHPQYTEEPGAEDDNQGRPFHLIWAPDSSLILSWGPNNILYIWNARDGSLIFTSRKYTRARYSLNTGAFAWSPDGKYIATMSEATVDIWKPGDGNVVSSYTLPGKSGRFLSWSPDSQLLVVWLGQQLVVLTPGSNTPLFTHSARESYSSSPQQLIWSPDSKRLVSNASPDYTTSLIPRFTVWDARTGQHTVTYSASGQSNFDGEFNLAWSPDGKYIACQRLDAAVEIWKVG